jgi:trehalose 6-phosphate phosphatase
VQRGLKISNRAMEIAPPPPICDVRQSAILLDIDGTILDFAPSPRQVWVPADLRRTLTRLVDLTGGAVALVSGRTINDIDLIFSPLQLAAIGVHGAEMRVSGDADVQVRITPLSRGLKRKLATVAELGPGILVEDKGYSLALHYRLAPEKGQAILDAITKICADVADETVEVLPGKLVVDIKPAVTNKGNAVSELMQHPPFAGRRPIFIGDDTTDIPVFGVVPRFGGQAYSVGRIAADVDGHFDTPELVRAWLARIAAQSPDTVE